MYDIFTLWHLIVICYLITFTEIYQYFDVFLYFRAVGFMFIFVFFIMLFTAVCFILGAHWEKGCSTLRDETIYSEVCSLSLFVYPLLRVLASAYLQLKVEVLIIVNETLMLGGGGGKGGTSFFSPCSSFHISLIESGGFYYH